MARRLDPVDVVTTFFEKAPLEQATVLLTVVRGIVARRQPPAWPKGKTGKALKSSPAHKSWPPMPQPTPPPPGMKVPDDAEVTDAVAVPAHVKTSRGGLTEDELQS